MSGTTLIQYRDESGSIMLVTQEEWERLKEQMLASR